MEKQHDLANPADWSVHLPKSDPYKAELQAEMDERLQHVNDGVDPWSDGGQSDEFDEDDDDDEEAPPANHKATSGARDDVERRGGDEQQVAHGVGLYDENNDEPIVSKPRRVRELPKTPHESNFVSHLNRRRSHDSHQTSTPIRANLRETEFSPATRIDEHPEDVRRLEAEIRRMSVESDAFKVSVEHKAKMLTLERDEAVARLQHDLERQRDEQRAQMQQLQEQAESTRQRLEADLDEALARQTQLNDECNHLRNTASAAATCNDDRAESVPLDVHRSDIAQLEEKVRRSEDRRFDLTQKVAQLEVELQRSSPARLKQLEQELTKSKNENELLWSRFEELQVRAERQERLLEQERCDARTQLEQLLADKQSAVDDTRQSCLKLQEDALFKLRGDVRRQLDEERRRLQEQAKERVDALKSELAQAREQRDELRQLYRATSDEKEDLSRQIADLSASSSAAAMPSELAEERNRSLQAERDAASSQLARVKEENARLQRIAQLSKSVSEQVATPPRDVDSHHIAQLRSENERLRRRLTEAQRRERELVPAAELHVRDSTIARIQAELDLMEKDAQAQRQQAARTSIVEASLEKSRLRLVQVESERDEYHATCRKLKKYVKRKMDAWLEASERAKAVDSGKSRRSRSLAPPSRYTRPAGDDRPVDDVHHPHPAVVDDAPTNSRPRRVAFAGAADLQCHAGAQSPEAAQHAANGPSSQGGLTPEQLRFERRKIAEEFHELYLEKVKDLLAAGSTRQTVAPSGKNLAGGASSSEVGNASAESRGRRTMRR